MFLQQKQLYALDHNREQKEFNQMNIPHGIGDQAINKVIEEHPAIGEILEKHDIGCTTCGVGICLVKDVVSIHALGDEAETQIEQEITEYLNTQNITEGETT
jgi:hypothetical protein